MDAMLVSTPRPDWRDAELGTRVRVALWLMEKGKGTRFKKQELRDAFPGVEQVDRRMRDLRPAGWIIHTYRERDGLQPDELLLDEIGLPVWEAEHKGAGMRNISGKVRREVYERDSHRCVRCGITAGEEYPDTPGAFARMTLGHVNAHKSGSGATAADLVTECARCNETVRQFTGNQLDAEQVWDRIAELPKKNKAELLKWILEDKRPVTKTEERWAEYRQLPGVHREGVQRKLTAYFADEAAAE